MNDLDLESKLRSVRVPERPDEYWDDFPSRFRVQLRRERRGDIRAQRTGLTTVDALGFGRGDDRRICGFHDS